ncbi:MAG: hypothetical protein J7K98_03130 [Candidatus Aenigmarchaeota archaeon]|nr:hypothetical protein [Candidatus Aenigmarchaeota archaeon]
MKITPILVNGLRKSLTPKFFIPLFIFYTLASLAILITLIPLLDYIPSLLRLQFDERSYFILIGPLSVILLVFLISIWFKGAVIHMFIHPSSFEDSLKKIKPLYPSLLGLSIFLYLLNSVVSSLLQTVGFGFLSLFFSVIINWFFMFSSISIVVKKDTPELALIRSYNIVKKHLKETFFLLLSIGIVSSMIFLVGIFVSAYPLMKVVKHTFLNINFAEVKNFEELTISLVGTLKVSLAKKFYYVLLSLVSVSLFVSIAQVFSLAVKTEYFVKCKRKSESLNI